MPHNRRARGTRKRSALLRCGLAVLAAIQAHGGGITPCWSTQRMLRPGARGRRLWLRAPRRGSRVEQALELVKVDLAIGRLSK